MVQVQFYLEPGMGYLLTLPSVLTKDAKSSTRNLVSILSAHAIKPPLIPSMAQEW
jgi:hypothetical protein